MTMLLGMWVPQAAGVLQTRADEGEVGLTFNTFWAKIKITSDETEGPVSLPYNFFLNVQLPSMDGELQCPRELRSSCTDE